MQRLTISIDDELAQDFDALVRARQYGTRSEAVRDLVRQELRLERLLADPSRACVATLSYLYDHHDRTTVRHLMELQHEHHDLTLSATHVHLDHDNCLEPLILRGPADQVSKLAQAILAARGVRDGAVHLMA